MKNWAMPGKTDHQEGDEQKKKTIYFLLSTVLLKSGLDLAHLSFLGG